MSLKPAVAILSAAALLAGQAMAATPGATLASAKGDIVVVGGKTAAAKTGGALKAGDRVVVRSGSASVRFADGCTVQLAAGSMATVSAKSPCAAGKGVVAAAPADPAQWYKINGPLNTGTVLALTGSALLVGAVIYGVTDPTKCKGTTEVDGSCTVSP